MGLNPATTITGEKASGEAGAGRVGTPLAVRSRAKRELDAGLAAVGLTLSSPIWLLSAVVIKLDDRGPVFYKQHRFGLRGKPFALLKFRTMHIDSDLEGIRQAIKEDERISRVGRLLRRTGIDELPQLWTILKGDMTLVGPRALAIGESMRRADGTLVEFEDVPGFQERLAVKPGLTGLATIYLPKDADPLQKLEYDLRYINEYSFWLDVRLILLSLWISFRGRWETRDTKL